MVAAAKEKVRPYYPDDPSSIPRIAQVWLHKPVSPLVVPDVFARRRNFVNSDLHVLLVDADKGGDQMVALLAGDQHGANGAVARAAMSLTQVPCTCDPATKRERGVRPRPARA